MTSLASAGQEPEQNKHFLLFFKLQLRVGKTSMALGLSVPYLRFLSFDSFCVTVLEV